MEYMINLGIWNNIFCVPNVVVDNYMKLSTESDIKVLLYLLKNAGKSCDTYSISEFLGISEEQAEESINFWIQRGVIEAEKSGELVPEHKNDISQNKAEVNITTKTASARKIELERTPDFAPKEIAKAVKERDEADYLFKHCEVLYGRPLKHNEQRTLMIILEDACLPADVALILIDYCFSVNKATPAYMRAMALDWVNSEITTIEKAEQKAYELKNLYEAVNRFKRMFEITSALSKQQRDYIDKWVNVYGFSDNMINEAYQITLNSTGKLVFPYMNKILESWYSKGIKSIEQIPSDKKQYDNDKGEDSSFDIGKLEQLLSEEI